MGVDAFGLVMFGEVEGTEFCLVVEHVEVFVFQVIVYEWGEYLLLAVRI